MELKTVLEEIEVQKEDMETHRKKVAEYQRKFRECQRTVIEKMEKAASLEDQYFKSVTSKLSLSIFIQLEKYLL